LIKTIGIIGQGFVGNAVKEGMKSFFKIETFDIIKEKSTAISVDELFKKSDVIFVCLPTPMKKSGECDISIIEPVVSNINSLGSKTVILKSTIPPGTCDYLQNKCENLKIIFNPEFLTEAAAVQDFINQNRIVLGGKDDNALNDVEEMFKKAFPKANIIKTTTKIAESVKYVTNCFLSLKVSFANQLYDLCNTCGINYNEVVEISKLDNRLGNSHWKVPGPDGDRGYGGHCFPKDMQAFLKFAKNNNIDMSLIEEAIKYNDTIRKDRDWEKMKGRAVSE